MARRKQHKRKLALTKNKKPNHFPKYKGKYCNYAPQKSDLAEPGAIEKFILKGWLPEKPFIRKDSVILAFGSCFAEHVFGYLIKAGYMGEMGNEKIGSHIIRVDATMVNTYAIRQHLEWAYEGRNFSEDLWAGSEQHLSKYNNEISNEAKRIFNSADIFIITLGLSEVWCNIITGEVFWHAITKDKFNPEVHGFRITTVEENLKNLNKIHTIIRKHRPNASIILTLSPVPLHATFRPVSCITANSVSKAILRVAIDEFIRNRSKDNNLFYWPSHEIVMEYFAEPYMDDRHHIRPEIVDKIMGLFTEYFCLPGETGLGRLSDSEFLSRFTGNYKISQNEFLEINIILRNDTLIARIPHVTVTELEPVEGTKFKLKRVPGAAVEFVNTIEMDESITQAVFYMPGGTFYSRRKNIRSDQSKQVNV